MCWLCCCALLFFLNYYQIEIFFFWLKMFISVFRLYMYCCTVSLNFSLYYKTKNQDPKYELLSDLFFKPFLIFPSKSKQFLSGSIWNQPINPLKRGSRGVDWWLGSSKWVLGGPSKISRYHLLYILLLTAIRKENSPTFLFFSLCRFFHFIFQQVENLPSQKSLLWLMCLFVGLPILHTLYRGPWPLKLSID